MKETDQVYELETHDIRERALDVGDVCWAHPAAADAWDNKMASGKCFYDPNATIQQKKVWAAEQAEAMKAYLPHFDENSPCEMTQHAVPGCPEEPDTEAECYVIVPKEIKENKKKPVLFLIAGGGMTTVSALAGHMKPAEYRALTHKCVVVCPNYRVALDAPYPAAINDCHAVFQWIVNNAKELGIDPKKIVLSGVSSGGHLATALPFRLQRYGYHVRGVLGENPITDDREMHPSSQVIDTPWDSEDLHHAYRVWMGVNAGSIRVGPEAFANRATVEDCIGYPPLIIFTTEFDPDSDNNREFYGKVKAARSFAEYHCFGGLGHAGFFLAPDAAGTYYQLVEEGLKLLFSTDLNRPWVVEEYREKMTKKLDNIK